jgi:hypothetical protein
MSGLPRFVNLAIETAGRAFTDSYPELLKDGRP